MKNPDEHELERLAAIADLDPSHPERVAWESDMHRRVLLRCYLDFLEGDDAREPVAEGTRTHLRQALRQEIGVEDSKRTRARAGVSMWLRITYASAAIVLLGLGLRLWSPHDLGPTGVDRGAIEATLRLSPVTLEGDRLEFRWTPLPTADEYVVTLFRPDLTELLRLPATPDTLQTVATTRLDSLASEATVAWRVTAYAGGDAIGRSSVGFASRP